MLEDADLADTATTVATMSTFNAGQDCMAGTRVLVHEAVADELVGRVLDDLQSVVLGPVDQASTLGPIISAQQLARIERLVAGRPDHAKVGAGGRRAGRPGFYYEPTVISGLQQDDDLVQQEIFGPVITVQTFATSAEEIALPNGVPFGLSARCRRKH